MAYADLTNEQQRSIDDFLALLRPWCGEQARTNNHGDAVNTQYNANVSAILSLLDDTDEIPNKSGLAGATVLTKSEVISIVSHIQGVLTNYNTSGHRQLWVKACGAENLIG